MDSSSSYHTCTSSMEISKLLPPVDAALLNNKPMPTRRVEFAENNNIAISIKGCCNVSSHKTVCKNKFIFIQGFNFFFLKKESKYDNSCNVYDKENIFNRNVVKVENADDSSFEFSMMRRRSIDEVCFLFVCFVLYCFQTFL